VANLWDWESASHITSASGLPGKTQSQLRKGRDIMATSKIIITDLTRFSQPVNVCTAGTDVTSRACIRPMPYLKMASFIRLGILPGAILSGDFKPMSGLTGPHQEDTAYSNLKFVGPCTAEEFKSALTAHLFDSVEEGFEIRLAPGQKHIPLGHPVERSIITLSVDPNSVAIVEDRYKPGKIRVHFTDNSGRQFNYLSITDLGFYRYAEKHRVDKDLDGLNGFIRRQREAYLRIGLSRAHEIRGLNAYWMQVNGIYTFPDFVKEIRSYK